MTQPIGAISSAVVAGLKPKVVKQNQVWASARVAAIDVASSDSVVDSVQHVQVTEVIRMHVFGLCQFFSVRLLAHGRSLEAILDGIYLVNHSPFGATQNTNDAWATLLDVVESHVVWVLAVCSVHCVLTAKMFAIVFARKDYHRSGWPGFGLGFDQCPRVVTRCNPIVLKRDSLSS